MSVGMVRSVAVYFLLVGVPAAGLIWVLSIGRSVVAPPAIAGEWQITGDDAARCFGIERLSIDQSGRFLRVHTGAHGAEGRLDGERLAVQLRAPGGECAGVAIVLEGNTDGSALDATLVADDCRTCGRRTVRATRLETGEE